MAAYPPCNSRQALEAHSIQSIAIFEKKNIYAASSLWLRYKNIFESDVIIFLTSVHLCRFYHSYKGSDWKWASRVPLTQSSPMVSWLALGQVLPAGGGWWLIVPCPQHWWNHIWNNVSSAGPPAQGRHGHTGESQRATKAMKEWEHLWEWEWPNTSKSCPEFVEPFSSEFFKSHLDMANLF